METLVHLKLDNFFGQFKEAHYKKGEILIRADDEPSGVFYLKEGVIKRYVISSNGEELTLNTYHPISYFPMSWVINNAKSTHYYEAMTPVIVHKAPKEKVLGFLKQEPQVALDLLSRIYSEREDFFLRMEYLMMRNAKHRLVAELLIIAKQYGKKQGKKLIVGLKLTEKDLASQSGIARETVSRELKILSKKGIIVFKRGSLNIRDLIALEEELQIH